jgi:hypothetical protein
MAEIHDPRRVDPRSLRLLDLAPHEGVIVRCRCGRITEYLAGVLQRRHRLPSDTLIYDLQFKLRCTHCNRRSGFAIAILDLRMQGTSSHRLPERVVVEARE